MSWRERWQRLPWELTHGRGALWASDARRLTVLATHRHCTVRFGDDVYLGPGFSLHIPHHGTLIVGPRVRFRRGFHCEIVGAGRVVIGADTVFTHGCIIQCSTSIEIGERCSFGQDLMIVDGNHRFRDPSLPPHEQGFDFRPVTIGDDVMVTTKCTLIADIGERAVIGANSVVTHPIPPWSVAVGAPARPIEYYGPAATQPRAADA